MDTIDSIRLELEAERHWHRKDEEYLVAEIVRQRAFNYRLRAGLEWIIENADPKKCPMIVGRAKAALHE